MVSEDNIEVAQGLGPLKFESLDSICFQQKRGRWILADDPKGAVSDGSAPAPSGSLHNDPGDAVRSQSNSPRSKLAEEFVRRSRISRSRPLDAFVQSIA